MTTSNLASTTERRTIGLSRKRRRPAYVQRAAQLRAGVLCVLLGASLLVAGNPKLLWDIVGKLLPAARPDTVTLAAPVQLRIADLDYAKGNYEKAARGYTSLIAQHSTHPLAEKAALARVQTYVALGDLEAAQRALERFRIRAPRHPELPKLLLDVAALHFQAGDYEHASRNYTDVIALMTRFERIEAFQDSQEVDPPTPMRRRKLHNEKLRRIAERTEIERTARFNLALGYDLLDRDENALSAYKRFVRRFPRDTRSAEAYYRAGILAQRAGRLSAAIESFSMVWQAPQVPGDFLAASIYQAGRCLEKQRRAEDARQVYARALDLEQPDDEHRLASLLRLAYLLREPEPLRALEIYRDLADNSTATVHRALARQHLLELQDASAMAAAQYSADTTRP